MHTRGWPLLTLQGPRGASVSECVCVCLCRSLWVPGQVPSILPTQPPASQVYLPTPQSPEAAMGGVAGTPEEAQA